MNCIEIKNLEKKFDETLALSNINLNLKKGEIIALLGADGAGKSTLLRLIVGLLCADFGEIITLGFNPKKEKEKIVEITGYMPQKFGLYEDLTVIENLNLYSNLKKNKIDFEKLLDFTKLKPFKNRLAKDLSGGMKQKLGLACALLGEPELLILDEPSVGVDPLSRLELLELIKKTIGKNTSVIWSSSYLDEAFNFNSCIILDKGKVIFSGKTKTLGNNYETFEKEVIKLMGGYKKIESQVAKNYHIKNHNEDCVVVAKDLSKKFGDFWAVKNNSFCIKKGEIFGLLGPNGAGKSTTFQMMCALLKPSGGKGYIMGVDVEKKPTLARSYIGYMAQKFSLYQRLSVYDNLDFFAGAYGLFGKDKKEKIERMINVFELEKYRNTQTSLLPLGFKQRLSLSCALIHEPPILFLDEPTSGVDAIQRKEFWNHINALSNIGVSVLVTTHFMDEAKFCNNISLFYNGEIIALDKPEKLIKNAQAKDMNEAFIKLINKKREAK
ncbi:MAG: ABC transporter ATP-binding protein [Candidatus Gastranaerophilales bacterium]|nr:ABC transporter ATP-binding protein [Candidatus Gastranaerophilales bacterium]